MDALKTQDALDKLKVSANAIGVIFDNYRSGKDLYISIQRFDGYWLTLGSSSDSVTWKSSFDNNTCQFLTLSGENYVFPFVGWQPGGGARMIISEEPIVDGKAPDLATADFVFDKIEMGWPQAGGKTVVWNQTSVDFFGIPVQLEFAKSSKKVGFKDSTTRKSILEALLSLPSPYNQYVYPRGAQHASEVYRFFSPLWAGTNPDYPSANELLEEAIESGLSTLDGVQFTYGGYVMNFESHSVSNRTVTLKVTDSEGHNPQEVALSGITSVNAFSDTIKWDPSTGHGGGAKAAGLIGANINRGVLWNSQYWSGPQYYYVNYPIAPEQPGNGNEFNFYGQCLHDASIDNLCYAISYDDFFDQEAALMVAPGDSVRFTVLPFN